MLQGNCHTSLLATLHPSAENFEECLNTLQFLVRCQGGGIYAASAMPGGMDDPEEAAIKQLTKQASLSLGFMKPFLELIRV